MRKSFDNFYIAKIIIFCRFYFQLTKSNQSQVTLTNLDFEASGTYFCEVTIDNPIYTKASPEQHIHIIGMWWINFGHRRSRAMFWRDTCIGRADDWNNFMIYSEKFFLSLCNS
jgi:hypothetical protein